MVTKNLQNNSFKKLFKIANSQLGYFTAKQAVSSGIPDNNHAYHVKAGNWQKMMRGIYRLSNYPESEYSQLMELFLWSRSIKDKPLGVFSHQTALSLYELSDVNPSKISMSVPEKFQRRSKKPAVLVLYKQSLTKKDYREFMGFMVTTPLRTIIDVITAGEIAREFISQAVRQAIERGMITRREIEQNKIIKKYMEKK